MTNKVKYYLDETDQIEVDGHTLSRLYLAEDNYEIFRKYAIYGADNTNREMGGYVESLNSISPTLDDYDNIAWVHADSKVYGNSKLGRGVEVKNSTVVDSTLLAGYYKANVYNSTIVNSTIQGASNSTITDSTCSKRVHNSRVDNSNIRSEVRHSTIVDSTISGRKNDHIINANLQNVEHNGSLSGTFSNINLGDIERYVLYYRSGQNNTYPFELHVGPDGNCSVTHDNVGDVFLAGDQQIEQGDVSLDEVRDAMSKIVDGKPVGSKKSLQTLQSLEDSLVLTDSDFTVIHDFENTLEL